MGATNEAVKISICIDCTHLIANGECDPDQQERVGDALAKNWPGYHITLGDLDCEEDHSEGDCACDEPHFSWSSCDGCGSHLGGDRHPAAAWKN